MKKRPLVSDTTLLLYLGRLERAHFLSDLFAPVYVPEQVALELDAGRLLRRDTINPRVLQWASVVQVSAEEIAGLPSNRPGIGEQAVIGYALAHGKPMIELDDERARQLAEEIGLQVIGTVGIFVQAKRVGLVSAVRPLLDAVQAQGFRMDAKLYDMALQLAKED